MTIVFSCLSAAYFLLCGMLVNIAVCVYYYVYNQVEGARRRSSGGIPLCRVQKGLASKHRARENEREEEIAIMSWLCKATRNYLELELRHFVESAWMTLNKCKITLSYDQTL